jgi:hypothetical protein
MCCCQPSKWPQLAPTTTQQAPAPTQHASPCCWCWPVAAACGGAGPRAGRLCATGQHARDQPAGRAAAAVAGPEVAGRTAAVAGGPTGGAGRQCSWGGRLAPSTQQQQQQQHQQPAMALPQRNRSKQRGSTQQQQEQQQQQQEQPAEAWSRQQQHTWCQGTKAAGCSAAGGE